MKSFGTSITHRLIDLINIYNKYGDDGFIEARDEYLNSIEEDENSCHYEIDTEKIKKLIFLINKYVDSFTCESEMKMDLYFNEGEPAFIDDKVNTKLFNFDFADKIYKYAMKNNIDVRMHTIVWYRHVPKQLDEYLNGRTAEDRKRLIFDFIRKYMECLNERFPNCYCIDVINEMVADPDEIRHLEEAGLPIYEYDEDLIRKDYWYNNLGKDYYVEVYKIAREVFGKNKKLFYNDNNEGNTFKQEAYVKIINKLKEEGLKQNINLIDGFGMQSHYWGDDPENKEFMNNIYTFYTNLGLEIQITEFDVSNHSTSEIQERIFKDFIEVIKLYDIDTFTIWGLNDCVSWLREFNPTIVDRNFDIKEFGYDYLNYFSNKVKENIETRMSKTELIELLETLKLDREEFWVLSSSALVLRDIYPDAGDLDIAVTDKGLEELKKNYNLVQKENGWYIVSDKIECVCDGAKEKIEYQPEKVGDYYVQNINEYYNYLVNSEREKDKARLLLVEKYIDTLK